MKLFLKAIAIAAKDPKFKGHPLQELNHLLDVAESSELIVWHDDFCFNGSFWDWGNRETGNINWGGYGSSYNPANEKYFKFQYPGDTATMSQHGSRGKLVARKGAKPLDAVEALVLPEADVDGTMQALLAKAGAHPFLVAEKDLHSDAILDLLTKKNCNFLLTADTLPAGLIKALEEAAETGNYFFTLPVSRLRPLLEKTPKAPVKRGPKAPPAFADKDDAKAFSKLKALLTSQKLEEIDQAINLLPGLPGVCDKLLDGIHLAEGIAAWTNDKKAWKTLPCDLSSLGQSFRLDEVPKNDLFNSSESKRYALFSVINAAPDDCAAAQAIREGLVALHWVDAKLPPLANFKALQHLYLTNSQGAGFKVPVSSIVHRWTNGSDRPNPMDLDWIYEIKTLRRIGLYLGNDSSIESDAFLKKASFPALEEINLAKFTNDSPSLPAGVKRVKIHDLRVSHQRLPELLAIPHLSVGQVLINGENSGVCQPPSAPNFEPANITPVQGRGEPLAPKELSALKKLLRDDSPETVARGLQALHSAAPATIDALLEKSTLSWVYYSKGELGSDAGSRLSGPFFDSLKRNSLGELVRINLLSLATPGCQPADDIKRALHTISLPEACVPIDVGGFVGIHTLKIMIAPSNPTDNCITGLEKLTTLQKLELRIISGESDSIDKVFPLRFIPPQNVTEMEISSFCREIHVKPDFITVSPNLQKLKIEGCWPLADIPLLKGLDASKLEELHLDSHWSSGKLPPENLTGLAPFVNLKSLSGTRPNLMSLNGVEAFKSLCSLEIQTESLEDIKELAGLTSLEKLKLSSCLDHELIIGDLAALPLLNSLDFGEHKIADPQSLLKFRPETFIKLKNLNSRNT